MYSNIVGEPFDPFVYKEIDHRQSNQFSGYNEDRTPDQIQYLNNQNSWIKLASSVSISGSEIGQDRIEELLSDQNPSLFVGSNLAKNAILFGGLSSQVENKQEQFNYYIQRSGIYTGNNIFNKSFAYGIGNRDQGIQPMPGITDLSIDCINRGSIRKATLNIKAYNKFQFELIELLYLRIGYTMMLEWGNSRYLDPKSNKIKELRNTIIEDKWFQENGTTQLDMLTSIIEYRKKYSSNYDGFMGKVTNFTWSFNNDGSYDISLNLITVGDIIESLQVNLPLSERIVVEELKSGKKDEESTPINEIENVVEHYLFTSKQDKYDKLSSSNNYLNLATKYTEEEQDDLEETIKVKPEFNYYVTLGEFLNQLHSLILPSVKALGGSAGSSILQFDTRENENLISYGINQTPLDPRVCLFNFSFVGESVKGLKSPWFAQHMKEYVFSLGNVTAGKIMNLYLNFDFIEKCLKQNLDKENKLSLFNFLSSLCDGINIALGGVNKLEPIIKDDHIITIIDQNPIYGLIEQLNDNNANIVPLEIYGYNLEKNNSNFVKNISLNTSITPDLASMVSIGATAGGGSAKGIDATSFSKWNAGLIDRFNEETTIPDIDPKILEQQKIDRLKEKFGKEWDSTPTVETITSTIVDFFKSALAALGTPGSFGAQQAQNEINAQKRAADPTTTKTFVSDPKTGKPAGTFTRSDFIERYFENYKIIEQQNADTKEQNDKLLKNYLLYLADAFGGTNVTIAEQEGVTKTDPQFLTFDPKFISRAKSSYREYLRIINENARKKAAKEAKKLKDIYSSNQIGFIPISLNINLQGISGIKIYNKLSINQKFLPKNYPESLHFVVTKVNHQLKDNTWETSLDTISIPVTKEQNLELQAPVYSNRDEGIEVTGPIPPTDTSGRRFLIIENRDSVRARNPVNFVPKGEIIGIEKVIQEIHPEAKSSFRTFLSSLDQKYPGYKLTLNAIGRSFERSAELKEQNNKNALPGLSKHNYYAAADFNITDPNGVTYMKDGDRAKWIKSGIVQEAKNAGLKWGGNFANYEDCIHFYYDFDINTAYQNALLMSPEDINKVDGYKVPLGPILGPETETVARNNEFSLNT